MSEYSDVLKMLATKLKKDRANIEYTAGSEDLNYVMSVKLQQEISDALVAEGFDYKDTIIVADRAATKYLDSLIKLAELY